MDVGSQGRLSALKAAGGGADVRLLVAARCGIYMLLGGVMSCSRVLGDGAPFGMAMVACSGPGISGVFALTGAALGYLLGGGLEWGIRYIAAAVLVYTVSFVFHELEAYKSSFFMPTAAGLVMGLTGFLGSFSMSLGQLPAAAEIFLEVNLAFGGTYFFREALSGGLRETETAELRHSVSVMIMSACALMAFSRIVIFDTVSIGRFMALVLVMTSAMKGGMLTGAAVGTVLGLAMDVSSAGAPFYTMAYSFAGLLSGVFGKHGRVIFVLSFILAGALSVVCAWTAEVHINALFETFCASVVFMLLPNSLLNHVGLMLQHMETPWQLEEQSARSPGCGASRRTACGTSARHTQGCLKRCAAASRSRATMKTLPASLTARRMRSASAAGTRTAAGTRSMSIPSPQ